MFILLLASGCVTTRDEVGEGLFTCISGRSLKVRKSDARRIVTVDDGPEIVLAPTSDLGRGWWEYGVFALRIRGDAAWWQVRGGGTRHYERCKRGSVAP